MTNPDLQQISAEVRAEWRNWTRIVRLFASRREGRFLVAAEEYERLHRRLLHLMGVLAQEASGQRRSLYRRLQRTLTPWVTLESLNSANRSVLNDLLDRCMDAQQQLDRRLVVYARRLRRALFAAIAIVLLAALVAIVAVQLKESQSDPLSSVGYWGRWIYWSIAEASMHWKLIYLGGISAAFGVFAVWFAARRY